jgi:hypothetical protein
MAKIVAVGYVSLDGVFENPTWTQAYFDERSGAFQAEAMQWAPCSWGGSPTRA